MRARLRWAAALPTVLLLTFGPLLALAPPASAAETIQLTQPTSPVLVGATVQLKATVSTPVELNLAPGDDPSSEDDSSSTSTDEEAAPSGPITFTIKGPVNSSPSAVPSDAVAIVNWVPRTAGQYTIVASRGDVTSNQVTVVVTLPPPSVTLRQDSDVSQTGSTLTVTATATNPGSGFWNIDVVSGPNPRTLAEGERANPVTVKYTGGTGTGDDVIRASWHRDDRLSAEARVSHRWIGPPPGVAVTLTPATASSLVGSTLGVGVSVSGGEGRGVGRLSLDVDGVPLAYTGSAGSYSAEYQGTAVGSDTITATWTDDYDKTSDSATHTWTAPRVLISNPSGGSDLGETASVTVDLPDGFLDGSLAVDVLSGPHTGPLEVTEGNDASYTGVAPGTDTIQASLETAYGTFTSGTVTRTWNTPTVTLGQESTRSALGASHTVTAEVSGTTASEIAFAVSGANAGAPVDVSGSHPSYTGTYVGEEDGTDAITATITVFDRTYTSNGLSHTWVTPTVTVDQDLATSKPGQPVLLTASVAPTGTAGAVTFLVEGAGPPRTFLDDGTDGSYTASYTRDDEGTDTITATFASGSASFDSGSITHVWDDEVPPAAVLSPAGATNCVGSSFTPTVTLTDGDDLLPGVAVQVTVTMDGAQDQVLTATTDVDGRATVSYAGAAPGTDTLVATAEIDGETLTSARLTHVWEACELVVSVAPPGSTSLVGSSFTPTVSVRDAAGAPVADATVEVTVTMADQPDVTVTLTTDADGLASTTYDRPVAGADRIDAVATSGERTGRATIDHFWRVQEGLRVTLGPAGTSSLVDSEFTATALVTDGEAPVADAQVAFRASLPGQPDITLEAVTDEDGQASFPFTRPVAGTDTVEAEATVGDRSGRASVVHLWNLVPGLDFTLEPPGTSSLLDEDFTATATVLVDGEPLAGVDVAFAATQPGQDDRTGTAPTGDDGRATFTYTRSSVGTDLVTASVVLSDGRRGDASMTHLWRGEDVVAPPPPEPPTVEARGVIVPGGLASVIGTGCPPRSQVTISVNDEQVATTRAGRDGSYEAQVRLPGLTVGEYPLEGRCVPLTAENEIAVVAPASTSGTAGAEATTAVATFAFFVLLGGQLVRGAGGYSTGGG
jgi:hypothetical protein